MHALPVNTHMHLHQVNTHVLPSMHMYPSGTYLFPQEVGGVEYSHPRIAILHIIYLSKPRVNWTLDRVMTLAVTLCKAERNTDQTQACYMCQ